MWDWIWLRNRWYRVLIWMLKDLYNRSEYRSRIPPDTSKFDSYYLDFIGKPNAQDYLLRTGRHKRLTVVDPDTSNLKAHSYFEAGVEGRKYVLNWALLFFYDIELVHIFRGRRYVHEQIWKAWLVRRTGIHWLIWIKNQFWMWGYAARLKTIEESVDVLRAVMELEDEGVRDGVTFILLQIHIYGSEYYALPEEKRSRLHRQVVRHLKGLAESGDLRESNGWRYTSTGQALRTILDYEREERKQREEKLHRRLVIWLTLILAISSGARVMFELIDRGWLFG